MWPLVGLQDSTLYSNRDALPILMKPYLFKRTKGIQICLCASSPLALSIISLFNLWTHSPINSSAPFFSYTVLKQSSSSYHTESRIPSYGASLLHQASNSNSQESANSSPIVGSPPRLVATHISPLLLLIANAPSLTLFCWVVQLPQ